MALLRLYIIMSVFDKGPPAIIVLQYPGNMNNFSNVDWSPAFKQSELGLLRLREVTKGDLLSIPLLLRKGILTFAPPLER